ncbi:polysaccharide deacetylase family protein [Sansalvadorimonas sp. 2012CJ34-2]|uniref:Polysaccharide deacetylase family protein n=1 Tax=Parendozoicomonas callyspongiae TaxID=2942213 RepID=A0ABT0PDJ0_9GAMM|nr:polysaccharide deacetylase family protein [Sansalvadorimonas sp. 2012CJ34-2]MCL6269096.1 polysaccharide deacetylase family protein [Sansalvadorimonas sp. 2012CJ34-2]
MLKRLCVLACSAFSLLCLSMPASSTVVLQYHHIDATTPASTSTQPALFVEHLKWLKENGFTVHPLPAIAEKIRLGQALPDKSVVITFDDAYKSIYTEAFPILKEYDYPFTIFVDTLSVDERRNRALSWGQLREMAGNKASLANHTVSHDHLVEKKPGESTVQWLERIRKDLHIAENRIKEETGQNLKLFAWTFGESSPELEQLILEEGYLGFGQQSGPIGSHSNKAKLPRFPMGGGYGSMKNFPLKVRSLPLPVVSMFPETSVAPLNGQLGQLQLTLKPGQWSPSQIACYALGSNLDINWADKQKTVLDISLPDLPLGRSRVNCTSPGPDGRWFWFSKEWVRLTKDGKALD